MWRIRNASRLVFGAIRAKPEAPKNNAQDAAQKKAPGENAYGMEVYRRWMVGILANLWTWRENAPWTTAAKTT
jgi:hypothetical protein